MAEDLSGSLSESFHSLSHSSTSFRLVDSGTELPSRARTSSAPITGGNNDWDTLGSSPTYIHSQNDSFGQGSQYQSPSRPMSHTSGSTTLRPMTPIRTKAPAEKDHLATPTAPTSKSMPKPSPAPEVLRTEVWRDLMLLSDGRDKAFKLLQYTMKVYLYFHVKSSVLFRSQWGQGLAQRLKSTASGLSLTRKCLIMFNWLKPLLEIVNPPPLPYAPLSSSRSVSAKQSPDPPVLYRLLHASPPTLLDLFNGIADDTFTLSRLGLIGPRIGNRADRVANWLWFLSTLAGLVEVETESTMVRTHMSDLNERIYDVELDPVKTGRLQKKPTAEGQETRLIPSGKPNNVDLRVGVHEAGEGLHQLQQQSWTLTITRWKLLMDLIFVSYEVFRIKRFREPAMALSGLLSAILSSSKLFAKQRAKIMKARVAE